MKALVKAFNKHKRPVKITRNEGSTPALNHWHISTRAYNQNQNPSDVIFLVNPENGVYVAAAPPPNAYILSALTFERTAEIVAQLLLKAFAKNGIVCDGERFAPFK